MSHLTKYILYSVCIFCFSANVLAQEGMKLNPLQSEQVEEQVAKTTELGVGMDFLHISRMNFYGYRSSQKQDIYNLQLRNIMMGGNLYIARELNPWLYADIQATVGLVNALDEAHPNQNKFFAVVGPGLQFRLTPLFKKYWVEPYLRVGGNYLYKDFFLVRTGSLPNFKGDPLHWSHKDWFNRYSDGKKHFLLASFGVGVNTWVNHRWGFGIQADYVTSFNKSRLNFPRLLARVMVRFGAPRDKKVMPQPEIRYVDRVEYVEKPVEIIKYIEKPGDTALLFQLISSINFEFDKYDITPEAAGLLDQIANILKTMPECRFLITGCTDIRGSVLYNERLSARRADAVVKGLEERGVPTDMLKSRGVGKRIAVMPYGESHIVREGDRKVTIELVNRMEYWHKLPKR